MRLVCLGVRALCVTSCLVTFVHSVEFDLMTVGDPGNRYDRTYGVPSNPARYGRFGAVNYAFEMATTEVTHNQYVEFLNSVAASDPHGLFDELMMSRPRGGIIRTGEEGSYAYEAKPKAGYLPVTFVTFWDAARFANWMHNGQPTGPSGPETTESGAYELGGVTYPDNFSVTRNPDAVWFLPSENEWYKAAYYDPRTQAEGGPGGNDHYWFYPTMSDEVPAQSQTGEDGAVSNAGPNVANYDYGSQWNGFYGQTHVVGTAGSTSYYGLFDMGGNVWEYNESIIVDPRRDPTASFRGARGACWDDPHWLMSGDRRGYAGIENCGTVWQCFNEAQGFRMATIPTEREKGDFDYDWNLDAHDIDLLTKEIRSGENAVQMDLNGDRLVNLDDRTVWVEKLAGSEFGDSNLDGSFDSSDLVQVFQFGEYEDTKQFNSTWATGDWNGDGDFSSADIVHAFMNASYSGAKVSAVQAVPEPQSYVPITFAALFFVFNRRRVCIV